MKALNVPSLIRPLGLVLALVAATTAHADEAAVKKSMEAFIGAPAVEKVTRTDYAGLYEVVLKSGQLVYTDARNSFIIDGSIIDTATRRDVTQARMNQLSAIDFSSLPLEQAVKVVKGKGTRVIATFEDPNCGYCKKLAKEIAKLDNVTVYVFLYPILSQDSLEKSKQIWCSSDRAKAWNDWMVDGKAPSGKGDCDTAAVQKTIETGRKLAINGTPTIFFADGERIPGAVPLARIEEKLAQTKGK